MLTYGLHSFKKYTSVLLATPLNYFSSFAECLYAVLNDGKILDTLEDHDLRFQEASFEMTVKEEYYSPISSESRLFVRLFHLSSKYIYVPVCSNWRACIFMRGDMFVEGMPYDGSNNCLDLNQPDRIPFQEYENLIDAFRIITDLEVKNVLNLIERGDDEATGVILISPDNRIYELYVMEPF